MTSLALARSAQDPTGFSGLFIEANTLKHAAM
jgi:hypothetical protein